MLKVRPVRVELTVIVPEAVAQVVCIRLAVGAKGAEGAALIVTLVAGETHPAAFLAVRL